MIKKKFVAISICVGFVFFIGVSIFSRLSTGNELPGQISGALLEAVITALLTYVLLSGQASQEEIKERNVKVFEEKTIKYNNFITKLWEIWEDRKITLEELNELVKIISRDIILYTKQETVEKILISLNRIADLSNSNDKNIDASKLIQNEVFNIINQLALEINLGGEITEKIQNQLNSLEDKVIPFLNKKIIKQNYLNSFYEELEESEIPISNIEIKNNFIWIQIKQSNVLIKIGQIERQNSANAIIGIYCEFWGNRKYQKYRDASRGWRKDFLKSGYTWHQEMINFSDTNKVEKITDMYLNIDENNKPTNELAKKVINFYNNWKIDGKNLEQIIDEVEGNLKN